jgi:DNA-binding PadR family transcriptional regulator
MNPRVFMILLAFAEGSAHGYQVKKAVEERSGGSVKLDAGSLYRSLAKLVDEGLVVESGERPDPDMDDTRRRYYELTDEGKAVVSAEAGRLADLVEYAKQNDLVGQPAEAR